MPNLPSNNRTSNRSPWAGNKPGTELSNKPSTELAAYLNQLQAKLPPRSAAATGGGRLIFAIDATASREPTWDHACQIQGEMFEATAGLGGLSTKLVYYRGFDECKASRWVYSAADLHRVMRSVSCVAGQTQIARVLDHAIGETGKAKVGALVFVGDAMEEQLDRLCHLAGQLGRLGVPIFACHEGNDPVAASAFKQIATLSNGVYLPFDLASIARLKELLGAIAVYAAGGHQALEDYGRKKGAEVLRLTAQLKR